MTKKTFHPDSIRSYFRAEWGVLFIVSISGLIYNVGLLANPWFEGKLAGCLVDVLSGKSDFSNMLFLVIWYIAIIAFVQIARYIKRFYVRRFANNINRRMKKILYRNLLQHSRSTLENEGAGNLMTKAISDVDDCVEGMRKFTTEIYDTGVAILCYVGMLLWYDWRLAIISMLFPPISYLLAEKMKHFVQRTGAYYKEQSGTLSADTLDRIANSITYRVFGCEQQRNTSYEKTLTDYEKASIKANIWVSSLPPLYNVICMLGVPFIIYFGSHNILGSGWCQWDIAAFTTFLVCYTKLSTKSSKAAKLFNAVHKAQVSWKRIQPFMKNETPTAKVPTILPEDLTVKDLGFCYPSGNCIFTNLSFHAKPGQIIGITGPVACGKSTLGKVFLCENPYMGSIRFGSQELSSFTPAMQRGIVGYLGHDTELFNDSIKNNIFMDTSADCDSAQLWDALRQVCFDDEVAAMPQQFDTSVGNNGVRLSGGQAKRLALARTLHFPKPILILDDPFSALDRQTEETIFQNLKAQTNHPIIFLISHRLYLFPELEQVIWMDKGTTIVSNHDKLMTDVCAYRELYNTQKGGDSHEN